MFRLELLITLLNSTAVPAGAAVGVNATLTRVVDVATTELQVQNLNIQTSELSRFGELNSPCLMHAGHSDMLSKVSRVLKLRHIRLGN